MREITGFSNPLVKQVRSLRDKKHRRTIGKFLAEGLRILTEALDAGVVPEMLWHAPESAAHPIVQRLIAATEDAGGEVFVTSPDILSKLSGKDNPGSVIGVYPERLTPLTQIDRGSAGIWIVDRRCATPATSARCCAPATRSARAG